MVDVIHKHKHVICKNAAYCRLKNITLGYTLPAALTKRIAVQNVRVFVSAENILTITNFIKTADPELAGVGYLSIAIK